jgi:cytidine deaminase
MAGSKNNRWESTVEWDTIPSSPMEDLPPDVQACLRSALVASERSVSPYSSYRVGAALLTEDGQTVTGSFVNAACGLAICAERAAILTANAAGHNRFRFLAVSGGFSAAETERASAPACTPCGACRQFLWEYICRHGATDLKLYCSDLELTRVLSLRLSLLLPLPWMEIPGPNRMP